MVVEALGTKFVQLRHEVRMGSRSDITRSRGTEMLLPLWRNLFGLFGNPNSGFRVVRGLKEVTPNLEMRSCARPQAK
jgi:hypothetical protein